MRPTRPIRPLVVLCVMALFVAYTSCGSRSGLPRWFAGGPVKPDAAVEYYGSCDALLARLHALGLEEVSGDVYLAGGALEEGTGPSSEPAPESGSGPSKTHTATNVEVAGVDEADVVKTDGRRIVAIVNGELRVITLDGEARARGRLDLPVDGSGWELFLDGDHVLAVGSWEYSGNADDQSESSGEDLWRSGDDAWDELQESWSPVGTAVLLVDIADPDSPVVRDRFTVEGEYDTARLVEGVVHVVVRWSDGFWRSSPRNPEERAEQKRRVRESELDDWLPTITDAEGHSDVALPCDRVALPTELAGFGMLAVYSVPLGERLTPEAGGLLGRGYPAYVSTDDLMVAVGRPFLPFSFATTLYEFSLTAEGIRYRASGSLPGVPLSEFSISEDEERLRVVTTDLSDGWWDKFASYEWVTEAGVTVLERRGAALVPVGHVEDMGRGDELYSVRFLGDTAYVGTFGEVDPFYVVDLTDATAPRVVRELKIPGYSAYLHPIDATHVLGIGQEVDPETGVSRGVKANLMDVADPAAPVEVDSWTLPWKGSLVEDDYRAFLYWAPGRLAVLPVDRWTNGAVVLELTDTAIREKGTITQADQPGGSDSAPIWRSLVVGEWLWTFSDEGAQANALADLSPKAWIDW